MVPCATGLIAQALVRALRITLPGE